MRMKKIIAALAAACMMVASCTTAFASENTSWKNYDYSQYTSSWSGNTGSAGSNNISGWSWGDGSSWGSSSGSNWNWGNESGWNWGGNTTPDTDEDPVVEEVNTFTAPKIKECRYIHQSLNAPDCLKVTWDAVDGAVRYEMEMCNFSCDVIKSYTTTSTGTSIPANRSDDKVTGCCRGRKIRVRAIDQDGNPGKWSEYSTVGCNSVRG